jgi:hypothetical protein
VVYQVQERNQTADLRDAIGIENLDGGLYRAVTLAVVSHRRRCAALVYIGCDREPGRPRPGYLEIVTQAARDAGLPPRYLRCLERWASA